MNGQQKKSSDAFMNLPVMTVLRFTGKVEE
jgi:hypothetical protein